MKIYIAKIGDQVYESIHILGVFSTEDKAKEAINNYHDLHKYPEMESDEILEAELDLATDMDPY